MDTDYPLDYPLRSSHVFSLSWSERVLSTVAIVAYTASTVKLTSRDPTSTDTGSQALIEIALLSVALIAAIMPFIRRGGLIPQLTPPAWGFAAFAGITMVSSVFSWWLELSLVKGCLLIAVVLVALFLCISGRPKDVLSRFYWCALAVVAIGLVLALVSERSLFDLDEYSGRQRLQLFGWHPLNLADISALTLLVGRLLPRRPHWTCQLFLLIILLLTGARATGIVLILIVAISSVIEYQQRFKMTSTFVVGVAMAGLAVWMLVLLQPPLTQLLPASVVDGYFGSDFVDEVATLNGRTDLWKESAVVIGDSLAFGYGLDGARATLLTYTDWSGNSHNAYAEILLAGGLPALAAFLFGWGAAFIKSVRASAQLRLATLSFHVFLFGAALTNPIFTGLQFLPLFLIVCVDALVREELAAMRLPSVREFAGGKA